MGQLVIYALLGIFAVVHCEIHTLQYIYTSLSKPINVPDVYKFTAMGILDDRGIDYYNSQDKVKKPTQGWMAENLKQDYWDKGTQSRKSKEEWFNVNVKILMDRMRQNDSDVHILQWMHGCTIEKTPDGETKFVKGFDQYGYDGNDFLSFNDADMQWVAPVTEARPTKTKWDSVDILNQYTKGYLERECVEWLNNFLTYSEAQLRQASPPEVTIFARKSPQPDSRNLVCFATGFYPKDIEMDILQNDIPLTESNGVTSSGVRPNGDGTHQLMKTLTIGASDKARYSCLVKHRALTEPVKKDWDGTCCNCATTLGIGVAVGIPIGVLLAAAVAGCLAYFFRRKFRGKETDETASKKSGDSGHGSNSSGSSNEDLKGQGNGQHSPLLPNGQINNGAPANGLPVETV